LYAAICWIYHSNKRVFPWALWDPTYVDESWINKPIAIIPKIQGWINQYAPGLGVAITEFEWGDDNIITGALAQVVVLGTFITQGVDFASRWVAPASGSVTELSYQIFTNYDGAGSAVSGSVFNAVSSIDTEVTAFLFSATGGEYYLILVNKLNVQAPVTVDTKALLTDGSIVLYSFSDASRSLKQSGKISLTGGSFQTTMPGWSAVLAVIRPN